MSLSKLNILAKILNILVNTFNINSYSPIDVANQKESPVSENLKSGNKCEFFKVLLQKFWNSWDELQKFVLLTIIL